MRLNGFLSRCVELGIKLNKAKMEVPADSITFMGHCVNSHGFSVDPEKLSAMTKVKEPQNIDELRQFLGIFNYVMKSVPNLARVTYLLHNLLKKDVESNWSSAQQEAFGKVKLLITNTPVLAFYDSGKELTLENDACKYGLGSCMLQDCQPLAYATRALTNTETRYAQIEKEMLAAIYGLEKFRHYTYGRTVNVITDHKPLVAICSKALSKAPRLLQSYYKR